MTSTTPKKSANRTLRKPAAKASQGPRGNLSKPEITKLLMQAQEAYRIQDQLGLIDSATSFDSWRRDQVMSAVGLPGISKISRVHFRTVFAHFLTLCGMDSKAYMALMTTGPKRDHGDLRDTHESSEALVAKMREALAEHSSVSLAPGATYIHAGWLLAAARQRTGKATLTLDTMAERIHPFVLVGLLSHLRNHIARREGRETDRRQPRKYPCKPDAGAMHEDSSDSSDPF